MNTSTPPANILGNISGSVLTLDPVGTLAAGTSYYVTVDAGAIRDLAGKYLGGLQKIQSDLTRIARS